MLYGLSGYKRPEARSLNTGAEEKLSRLDSRLVNTAIKGRAELPRRVTPAQVNKEAWRAGNEAARTKLMQDYSRNSLRVAGEIVKQYEIGAAHKEEMMKLNRQVAQIGAKHGRAALNFDLGMSQTQNGLSGYEDAFSRASVRIVGNRDASVA